MNELMVQNCHATPCCPELRRLQKAYNNWSMVRSISRGTNGCPKSSQSMTLSNCWQSWESIPNHQHCICLILGGEVEYLEGNAISISHVLFGLNEPTWVAGNPRGRFLCFCKALSLVSVINVIDEHMPISFVANEYFW